MVGIQRFPKTVYQKRKVLKAKAKVERFEKRKFIQYIYALDEFLGRFLDKVSEILNVIYLRNCQTFEFDIKGFSEMAYRWRKDFFPYISSF